MEEEVAPDPVLPDVSRSALLLQLLEVEVKQLWLHVAALRSMNGAPPPCAERHRRIFEQAGDSQTREGQS